MISNYIKAKLYPLHVAVASGDENALLQALAINEGTSINARDDLGLTPLQVACVLGDESLVSLLIAKGADITLKGGYDQNFCALSLAAWQGHASVVKLLVEAYQKQVADLLEPDIFCVPLLYSLENIYTLIHTADKDESFQDALTIVTVLAQAQKLALIVDTPEYDLSEAIPVSLELEAVSIFAPNERIYDQIWDAIKAINTHDTCAERYTQAKLLLHVFPLNSETHISYETAQGEVYYYPIDSEGIMIYLTPFVSQEIDAYYNTLIDIDKKSMDAFHFLSEIYHQSILFSKQKSIENAQLAYDRYQAGDIILLATGWEGHAINVILDPIHEYFIVANAGDRYENFSSGAYIYKIYNPSNLTPEFIFHLLNNSEQVDLELVYKYTLGLDKVEFLPYPEQEYGNCAWYSHKPAIQALLYIHSLNDGLDSKTAKKIAHSEYLGWEAYENLHSLEKYFDHNPKVDIDTVLDILVEHHASLFQTATNQTSIDPQEYHQAEYLTHVLASAQYKEDFYDHFAPTLPYAKPELIELFNSIGLVSNPELDLVPILNIKQVGYTEEYLNLYESSLYFNTRSVLEEPSVQLAQAF